MARIYRLVTDGDPVEQRAWPAFLEREFPSYETYWKQRVVPLTKRPEAGGFRPKAELAAMGYTDTDVCLAQLHYTVLGHLLVAFKLRQSNPIADEEFLHAIVRLSSAADVAHEFLERLARPSAYDPWSEEAGVKARRVWRTTHRDLDGLHDYRNRLLHGRLYMTVIDPGSQTRWVPRIGEAIDLDWRDVTDPAARERIVQTWATTNSVLDDAWDRVVVYLESNWQSALR